ncbi:hypothetical protein, partial [Endozoicomonas sp. SESOKO3]|uniref:hypothetical protein n=1 Tax=Endozoicomonas sp. SESOKO3 TaxID=2828744 RepID=UPI00214957B0
EGLLRLGTADFLMTVISDLEAAQLKSAIQEYSWKAFTSLMQETVDELAKMAAEAEGAGRIWTAPKQQLRVRLEMLFSDMLDYRVKHGRIPVPIDPYSDFFYLPEGNNKKKLLGYVDAQAPQTRQSVSRYIDEQGQVHYLATIEVREPWPALRKIAFGPPDTLTTAIIKSVQNPGLLGADPDVDGIFFKRALSMLATDTGTVTYQNWVKQSILNRLGQLDQTKLEHVTRSYLIFHQAAQNTAGHGKLSNLLLTARLRAITGGQSGSSWDTLARLQKIVPVNFKLHRVTSWEHQLPATTTDNHALLVARWKKLAQFNLPAGLYKLVDLFSAGEDLVRPILESGDRLSRHGLLLGRLYREVPLTLDPKQYLYQSRLDSNPPALTVGTKDTTFDHHKAIAIGKLFGLALLNHPDVVALGKAQKDLRAIWGLSATTTGRRYGLTTGLALGAFPDQPPLYTQLVNGLSSTDHNWQFATGSVDDFARVLYWLSARHDQDGLTEAVKRVLKYRRQHPGVSLDNFASALVKTHGNLPDYRAGLVLRQAIRTDEITFLKQTLKERSPSLIDGLNAIVEVSA